MVKYLERNIFGKLYRKTDLEKNNVTQIVKQEMEVSEMLRHPFLPKFYDVIENKRFILKLSEYIAG